VASVRRLANSIPGHLIFPSLMNTEESGEVGLETYLGRYVHGTRTIHKHPFWCGDNPTVTSCY
jgi:hypothetical protein